MQCKTGKKQKNIFHKWVTKSALPTQLKDMVAPAEFHETLVAVVAWRGRHHLGPRDATATV
jgi:hypothetical protein